jgi:hypothetical protein
MTASQAFIAENQLSSGRSSAGTSPPQMSPSIPVYDGAQNVVDHHRRIAAAGPCGGGLTALRARASDTAVVAQTIERDAVQLEAHRWQAVEGGAAVAEGQDRIASKRSLFCSAVVRSRFQLRRMDLTSKATLITVNYLSDTGAYKKFTKPAQS